MAADDPAQEQITMIPIGIIKTPFTSREGMPIQPGGGKGIEGSIVIRDEYSEGLADVDGFSHLILLYHLHRSVDYSLMVTPFLDDCLRGVFATRAPRRPNPIGLSIVRLLSIKDTILSIADLDILDGTPLLDIKPFIPRFEPDPKPVEIGWLTGKIDEAARKRADARFRE